MPFFDYKCTSCAQITTTTTRATLGICSSCGSLATRRFSFSIASSMPDHYNHSLGTYISNTRQLKDGLARKSEAATLATGIEHTFQPITLNTKAAHGITDEGLYETAKHKHDNNLVP